MKKLTSDLEDRLDRLERQCKKWRNLTIILGVTFGFGLLGGAMQPDRKAISAQVFQLLDKNGKVLGKWESTDDGTSLDIYSKGEGFASLTVAGDTSNLTLGAPDRQSGKPFVLIRTDATTAGGNPASIGIIKGSQYEWRVVVDKDGTQRDQKTIKAQDFQLLDKDGTPVGSWKVFNGGPSLTMSKGNGFAGLAVNDTRSDLFIGETDPRATARPFIHLTADAQADTKFPASVGIRKGTKFEWRVAVDDDGRVRTGAAK